MTLLEKIKDLTWWKEVIKLKDILIDFYNSVDILNERVNTIEDNQGGASQDLQSVVEQGSAVYLDDNTSNVILLGGVPSGRVINLRTSNAVNDTQIGMGNLGIQAFSLNKNTFSKSAITMQDGNFYAILGKDDTGTYTIVTFDTNVTVSTTLKFPAKTVEGIYTIATLDDIYKIPNLPAYASNTAAITGGLVVNNIYKTATGELRIVV